MRFPLALDKPRHADRLTIPAGELPAAQHEQGRVLRRVHEYPLVDVPLDDFFVVGKFQF